MFWCKCPAQPVTYGRHALKPMFVRKIAFRRDVWITRCDRGDVIITAYSGMTATVAAVKMTSGCKSALLQVRSPAQL